MQGQIFEGKTKKCNLSKLFCFTISCKLQREILPRLFMYSQKMSLFLQNRFLLYYNFPNLCFGMKDS